LSLTVLSQVVYDGVYSFSSSNDTNSTVKFALPMAVAILGVAAFLVAGFLLLLYYSRRSDVRRRRTMEPNRNYSNTDYTLVMSSSSSSSSS